MCYFYLLAGIAAALEKVSSDEQKEPRIGRPHATQYEGIIQSVGV